MHMRRAQELDPRSLNINTAIGLPYHFSRRFDKAIEEYKKAIRTAPDYSFAYISMIAPLIRKKDFVTNK